MPDKDGESLADPGTTPETPLHAYKDREEDVEGDVEKLKSGDPKKLQKKEIAGDDAADDGLAKH